VHPFWSSNKEKWACVRFSMRGGHGRSWSYKAGHRELAGEEGEGGEGTYLGWRHGEGDGTPLKGVARSSSTPAALRVLRSVREEKLNVRKKRWRNERRKRNEKKRKNMEIFPNLKILGEKNKR
jgi:hypothetical protein